VSIWAFLSVTAVAEVLLSSVWIAAFILLALPLSPLPAAAVAQGLFRWTNLAAAVVALLGLLGMALTVFGLSIEFKRAGSFAEVLIFFMLFFSGFFIPRDQVPQAIEALASVSPLYWFVSSTEQVLPGGRSWTPPTVLLTCSAGWFAVGVALTRLLLRRAAVKGTLARY